MEHKSFVVWLTGLSGAGKTTIAKVLKETLMQDGYRLKHLDGDDVRSVAKERLGFSKEDRNKNIQNAINTAKHYLDNGYIVITSFISPYRIHREWAQKKLNPFVEVFINTPLNICIERDPKGLYKKALANEIELFTGITDVYEIPFNPHLELKTHEMSVEACVHELVSYFKKHSYIS